MSEDALIELVRETIQKNYKPQQKRDLIKIWIGIFGVLLFAFTSGTYIGQIKSWIKSDAKWKEDISSIVKDDHCYIIGRQAIENDDNKKRAIYNDTVSFKTLK